MRIDLIDGIFWITAANIDLDVVRGIPHRAFDTKTNRWRAPVTPKVVEYLRKHAMPHERPALEKGLAAFDVRPLHPDFKFRTEPRDYQLKHLLRGQHLSAYAYLFEPGLGKSKVAIDDACLARLHGAVQDAAVICPNSITSNWVDEIEKHSPMDADIFVYDPGKKKAAQKFISTKSDRMRWFIIAVESLSSGEGRKFLEEFLRSAKVDLICDESSRIKTHDADRTKTTLAMAPLASRRRILTGTMITKGLHDAWSQYTFISNRILNGMNYYAYRNTFSVMVEKDFGRMTVGPDGKPRKARASQMIVGSKNEDLFADLTAFYSGVELKKDHLDLPKVYQTRMVRPTDAQLRAIKDLEKVGQTEVDGGILAVAHTLVRHLRIHQLCGGFATVEDDVVVPPSGVDEFFAMLARGDEPEVLRKAARARVAPIPGANPKITELLNIVEEIPGKLLVWCRFKAEIAAIVAALEKAHGPESVVQFHGDVSNDDRTIARRRFQTDDTCRFFVGQSRTGGIGITLTAANTAVYFSNDWSLETRIQSEDRNNRIGTEGISTYIDLVLDYPKSIDRRILQALREGRNYAEVVVQQMKEASQ